VQAQACGLAVVVAVVVVVAAVAVAVVVAAVVVVLVVAKAVAQAAVATPPPRDAQRVSNNAISVVQPRSDARTPGWPTSPRTCPDARLVVAVHSLPAGARPWSSPAIECTRA
jgi:hypothetical protein